MRRDNNSSLFLLILGTSRNDGECMAYKRNDTTPGSKKTDLSFTRFDLPHARIYTAEISVINHSMWSFKREKSVFFLPFHGCDLFY